MKIQCPNCGKGFKTSNEYEGKKVKCVCKFVFIAKDVEKLSNKSPIKQSEDNHTVISNDSILNQMPKDTHNEQLLSPKPAVSVKTIMPSSPVIQASPAPSEARLKPATSVDDAVRCPKCGSTSVTASKSGFSGGKGCLGALLFGPLGVLCGSCGGNKMFSVCMKCGHKWRIGK
jgi:DNA-directed RNA polymerase subunit M/transcription elongation factor TFIIS